MRGRGIRPQRTAPGPELVIDTAAETEHESARRVLDYLQEHGFLKR